MSTRGIFLLLFFVLIALFLGSLFWGTSGMSMPEVWRALRFDAADEVHSHILWQFRLPRSCSALLAGIALPVSGFILQALFRNPLAGPSVFGLTSASGLGVALMIFLSVPLGMAALANSSVALVLAAACGAFLATLLISFLAVRVRSNASLIIAGFMIAGFASALISLLQYYSDNAELRRFLVWNFGSLGASSSGQLLVFFGACVLGLAITFYFLKNLLAMQLGDEYAHSLGVKVSVTRLGVLLSASVLTAATTAFAGPIAFIGLAIPHLSRYLLKNANFKQQFLLNLLLGPSIMLLCLIGSEMVPDRKLPINIVLSLVGAPFLIWIVLKNREL